MENPTNPNPTSKSAFGIFLGCGSGLIVPPYPTLLHGTPWWIDSPTPTSWFLGFVATKEAICVWLKWWIVVDMAVKTLQNPLGTQFLLVYGYPSPNMVTFTTGIPFTIFTRRRAARAGLQSGNRSCQTMGIYRILPRTVVIWPDFNPPCWLNGIWTNQKNLDYMGSERGKVVMSRDFHPEKWWFHEFLSDSMGLSPRTNVISWDLTKEKLLFHGMFTNKHDAS